MENATVIVPTVLHTMAIAMVDGIMDTTTPMDVSLVEIATEMKKLP